ncbi:MAG TPA: response regulator transcription factor [Thermodesulfovibrionia bacterium]|nr:response regulator transcription factor [Thermodesulfovibrionia bacterium]
MNIQQAKTRTKANILVVDDEDDILELLQYNLKREGYQVSGVTSGEAGLKLIRQSLPDLAILDLMLPGVDGFEVCRLIKGDPRTQHIPVIMLTAKGEETDVVAGLELGADDYITKPFKPRILLARVKAALRAKAAKVQESESLVRIHELIIDPGRHEVLVDNEPIELTYTEFAVLHFLARQPGRVFSRYQIVDAVRGIDYPVTERSVDVQIVGVRKKLGPYGRYIETVRGVGYKFKE